MERLGFGETFGSVVKPSVSAPVTLSRHAPRGATPRHAHAFPYFCAVVGGAVLHHAGRREVEGRSGVVIAIAADEPHANRFGESGAICVNFHLRESAGPPVPAGTASPEVHDLLQEIAAELALGSTGEQLAVDSLAAEILDHFQTSAPPAAGAAGPLAIIEALEDTPQRDWTLGELAVIAGMHPASLARAFRKQMGRTIGDWRRRRRLTRLCLDLRFTDLPLADLAARHGFADQAHMTRALRTFAGVSPGIFRKGAT